MEKILPPPAPSGTRSRGPPRTPSEAAKTRFVIHHVPKRTDNDDDNDYGSNGLAWYQQGNYRLLAHTPDQLGKGRRPTARPSTT